MCLLACRRLRLDVLAKHDQDAEQEDERMEGWWLTGQAMIAAAERLIRLKNFLRAALELVGKIMLKRCTNEDPRGDGVA